MLPPTPRRANPIPNPNQVLLANPEEGYVRNLAIAALRDLHCVVQLKVRVRVRARVRLLGLGFEGWS